MTQMDFFGPSDAGPAPKPTGGQVSRLSILITVKAAPNPSGRYGETVCVAGLSTDLHRTGWLRLYPVNFRELSSDDRFKKYDIVNVDAVPSAQDQRRESWRPRVATMVQVRHIKPWNQRRKLLDPYVEDSMCLLNRNAKESANAKSLSLVRPREVSGLIIKRHPGWTPEEQRKIDAYVNQLDLLSDQDRSPLEAPRFRGSYRYRCNERSCNGHEQGVIDWEFVALQRRLRHLSDDEVKKRLENTFFEMMCDHDRDVAFYIGNQAKRAHVFSVLGVYYPKR